MTVKRLNSIIQPYLVPFLRKSLPLLRRSMQNGARSNRTEGRPNSNAVNNTTGQNQGPTQVNKMVSQYNVTSFIAYNQHGTDFSMLSKEASPKFVPD